MGQTDALNILAFDTAMSGISIGAVNKDGKSAQRVMETARGQAAHLIPLIQETLEEIDVSFQDLDVIGVTRGPGSFTGLRIGLTTARTLGLSLNIPVIGLNTAVLSIGGQNFGAKNFDRIRELYKKALLFGSSFMICAGLIIFFNAE